jgi:cytochrome c oxidase cbb3-type subunit I/II
MTASVSSAPSAMTERITYDDGTSRKFIGASVLFAIVGMLVGLIIALQLAFHQANVASFLSYGRLRPLHTNAVIFAFVGNMIFAGIYYSTQRLLKTRMASDLLSKIHFWGWQAIIVAAAVSLPLGYTQGKEYAELEWPIDIAIAVIWVVFAINFFWTLAKRREKHLYVALWFYIATIVTVAVLHIVNSLAMPVFAGKSYSVFGGAQDALVQWWYGHNAVAFFLTTPVLGIMYYFMPKAADRPVYSYRLSIIHFWALIFVYIWAGPHHLLYTALPDWAQSMGMVFSVMLWAPSWGGMLNGLLTLRGAWDRVRTDPVLKFFVAGVTFYGMATFEGPLLSIKSVNALAHYTDWIVGHVHSGALGWNGFMAAGMFYWMVPRLYGTKLHSKTLADYHFWLGTVGIVLYVISMWVAGINQGLMLRAVDPAGGLAYPSFLETLLAVKTMYWVRLAGGTMYFVGMLMMAYNLVMTVRSGKAVDGAADVPVRVPDPAPVPWGQIVFSAPVILVTVVGALLGTLAVVDAVASIGVVTVAFAVALIGAIVLQLTRKTDGPSWHRVLEGRPLLFTAFAIIAVLIGGIAEIVPSVVSGARQMESGTAQQPYTSLELEGRDIYLREGCYTCHSQMIRPMVAENLRYGDASRMEESRYDHPFQWGSKRTGPDLARVGGKYPGPQGALWHYRHLMNPRDTSPGSNMPPYAFMEQQLDGSHTKDKLAAMQRIGVPYTQMQIDGASQSLTQESARIAKELADQGTTVRADSEIIALIAYLQRLGVRPEPSGDKPKVAVTGSK